MKKKIILCYLLCVLVVSPVFCENLPAVFSTWEGFEVDKCASIWLIKRFINKNAEIKFFPKGTIVTEGVPFDTPDAKLRRYHNISTFEAILNQYQLNDPKLVYIGKIIHDIEINIWDKKKLSQTILVQEAIVKIIQAKKDSEIIINESCDYFNSLYQELK